MTVSNTPAAPVRNTTSEAVPSTALPHDQATEAAAMAARIRASKKAPIKSGSLPFWFGLTFSAVWGAGGCLVVALAGPAHSFAGISLIDMALGVSAIVSPIALIWMVVAYAQRGADVRAIAEPLRRQLAMITGESGIAEARMRRFNQGIREQIELLKTAQSMTRGDFETIMESVRAHRDELEAFENTSVGQVKDIQDIVRRNMQQIEALMDDKFTMLRILDDRLVQSGDTVARKTEAVRSNLTALIEELDARTGEVAEALERSARDGKKLSETTRLQEETLTAAAASAAETLNGLSGRIDMSVARFLERAGTAREEAERLAGALDAQTRSLDDVSTSLPIRVSEAENVLRGVADRLYASEQLACEQAVHLGEKLSSQVDGLQKFYDKFNERFVDVDGHLQARRNDFDALVSRMDEAASTFTTAWDVSMSGFDDRAKDTMTRFVTLNNETRKDADQIIHNLSETAARHENSAERLHRLSEESAKRLKEMAEDITAHLSQFETLRQASDKAGAEVQDRAAAAMQNLQSVLERLLSAREATTNVGETLVRDLHAAVDQNEHLIVRLNEAAQMSVRALGVASESLGKQEGESAERSRAASIMLADAAQQMQKQAEEAERGLRNQAAGLMNLLNETRTQINATEQNLQGFAARALPPVQDVVRQIDVSAEHGLQSMVKYGDGINEQLVRLKNFHSTVGGMGEDLTRVTADTISTIEQINTRFSAARTMQQDTARDTLAQFSEISERLQRELGSLDGQTAKAIQTLHAAAASVGDQTHQLLQTTEASGAKMQMVAASLQTDSTQIRAMLQQQAEDLSTDVSRAEKQFAMLGDALKQRTDAAYTLLDRVAVHYNDTTRTATQDLEERTQRLEQVTALTQGKAEALSATLMQQLTALGNGTNQLEAQVSQIGNASGKALQQLSALNEKITFTNEVANNNARQTITRLDECNAAILRQGSSLSEVAQNSVAQIQKTATVLGEQTAKLQDNNQRIDQNLRQLATTASTVQEQTSQIRNAMEQQNQRLLAQIGQSVAQLVETATKFDQTTETALAGADKVSIRFNDVSSDAATRLSITCNDMETLADKADTALNIYGANITQQAASLAVISEQLHDQYASMSAQNESQRLQLVELFDKLGGAHAQASDVAERTISRLSESLNQIQHQLGLLSDQSQSTVGNVRDASSGLTDQTALLIQNAQTVEQQARSVLSVTATLHEQAREMQEQIQINSKQSTDMLTSLVNRMTSGGGELRDFSSTTETALTSLNNALMLQTRDLTTTMGQFSDRQKSLTTALDAQRDVLNGLLQRLTLAQDETAATAERTASRIAEGSTQIARQLEVVDVQAQNALSSIQTASVGLTDQTAQLINNAQSAEQQVRSVLSVTATLQEQARQLQDQMQGDSQRTGETLGNLINKLATNGIELRDIGATTEASLVSLGTTMDQRTQELNGNMLQIGERQRGMIATFDAQRDSLNNLLNRLSAVQDETAATAERTAGRLAEGSAHIERQLEAMDMQAQNTLSSVQSAGAGFTEQSGLLVHNAQAAEQQVRSVLNTTATLQEQARQLQDQMQGDSQRTGETLGNLITKLAANGSNLRDISATTETALQSLNMVMEEKTQELNSQMGQIGERQRGMTIALEAQREALNNLLNRLSVAQDETAATAERTALRLAEGSELIEHHLEAIGEQAQSSLTRVQAVNCGFAEEAASLIQQAQTAEHQVRAIMTVTATLQEQARQLHEQMQSDTDRTGETLVNLVGKLASNGSELRDIAETTEISLVSLNGVMEQKTQEMNGSISQISERQRSMTTSLDVQREALNNLLNRLTIAQDETGATAERTASRLAEGTAQITRQLEAISDQAQSTLTSVQAANSGFAEEAGALTMQAQQAEQQMRGVLSVTANMQEQARQFRESLQAESARVIEQMNVAIAHLDMTTQALKTQGGSVVQVMDQTVLQFAANSRSTSEEMMKNVHVLNDAAQQVEQRLDNVGETVRGHLKLVAEVGDQTETHARQLADSAEYATNRLVALRENFVATDNESQNIAAQALVRIAEVKNMLQHELNGMAELSHETVHNVSAATQALASQSEALRNNLTMSESALREVADLVREENAQLPALFNRSMLKIEASVQALKEQTAQSDSVLIGTADRFISVTAAAREAMEAEIHRIGATAETANNLLNNFAKALADQMGDFKSGVSTLSDEQAELVAKASESVQQLAEAGDRIAKLRQEAAEMAERLTQQFDDIDERATSTNHRLVETGSAVGELLAQQAAEMSGRVVQEFEKIDQRALVTHQKLVEHSNATSEHFSKDAAQTVTRVAQHFDGLDQRLTVIGNKLTETSGTVVKHVENLSHVAQSAETHMTEASGQFREQLERIRSGLQSQVDDINRGLMQITAQLERTGTTLRSTTVGTVADVERIAQRFDQTSKEAGNQLTERTAHMRTSTEEVAQLLSGFGEQIDVLLNRLAQASDGIRRHEGDLTGQLSTALTQLSAVAEKLETGRSLTATVTEDSVAKLADVAEFVHRELQNLTVGSQTVSGIMRGVGQVYNEHTQNLHNGVREAHTQVQGMSKSIEEMQQRADRMRVSLKLQNEELMGSLQQILTQLSATGDQLNDTAEENFKKVQ